MAAQNKDRTLPPMLQQYLEYKETYSDALLFFQVGDFYELFFDDAVFVARELNLTLTSRDKHAVNPIPMCGVPMGAVDGYLQRLVEAGFSVAVVSQQPVPAGFKGMVPRFLERVITPGVQLLGRESQSHGTVAAVYVEDESQVWLASTDVQSGVIRIDDGLRLDVLVDALERRMVNEVVLSAKIRGVDRRKQDIRLIERRLGSQIKWREESYLEDGDFAEVGGLLFCEPSVKKTVRLLLNYLEETTIDVAATALKIEVGNNDAFLVLDATTRSNLEIDKNVRSQRKEGSLWGVLDHTVTVSGSRRLRELLCMPFANLAKIDERLDSVAELCQRESLRSGLRRLLKDTGDIGRIATRIALGVVHPRELGNLRDSLCLAEAIEALIDTSDALLVRLKGALDTDRKVIAVLQDFLAPTLPPSGKDGGIIRDGFHPEVDRLRQLAHGGKSWFENFAQEQREITGISSLKVKFNQVLGFFIEVTTANASKVPAHYEPRQNTTNARRYVVPELKQAEGEYFGAKSRLVELERQLMDELVVSLKTYVDFFRVVAHTLAELDVLSTAAEVAQRNAYCRPIMGQAGLKMVGARHPVLAESLGHSFVPNPVELGGATNHRVMIVTGPNMGGKSTFLRQTALITIMAQCGWFVPAESAHLELVDRVFARLGASDNLLEGESTFMVEMREAATIVAQANDKSLVVIDEVGRGTSTTDGVAIAQSILEWITLKTRSYCLFATHYHQLCSLAHQPDFRDFVTNVSVGSQQVDGEVVFTHQIVPGQANRSYGLEVARLAGLPRELVARAATILDVGSHGPDGAKSAPANGSVLQPALFPDHSFRSRRESEDLRELKGLRNRIANINPDSLSPREALSVLYDLVTKVNFLDKVG